MYQCLQLILLCTTMKQVEEGERRFGGAVWQPPHMYTPIAAAVPSHVDEVHQEGCSCLGADPSYSYIIRENYASSASNMDAIANDNQLVN